MTEEQSQYSHRVLEIVEQIKPILAGKGAVVQGGVLAELLSLWLAGHPADLRESLLTAHVVMVEELTEVNAAELRGGKGKPGLPTGL